MPAAFNAARDDEYEDVTAGCRDAVAELEELTAAREFRYQRLWDKDMSLRQLAARYQAVRGQDPLGARQAEVATAALARFRSALDQYDVRIKEADRS